MFRATIELRGFLTSCETHAFTSSRYSLMSLISSYRIVSDISIIYTIVSTFSANMHQVNLICTYFLLVYTVEDIVLIINILSSMYCIPNYIISLILNTFCSLEALDLDFLFVYMLSLPDTPFDLSYSSSIFISSKFIPFYSL